MDYWTPEDEAKLLTLRGQRLTKELCAECFPHKTFKSVYDKRNRLFYPRHKIVKTENSVTIPCLKCRKPFLSEDRAYNRICKPCRISNADLIFDYY